MDVVLIDRLRTHVAELQKLRGELQDPAVHGDPVALKRLGKRIAALEPEESLLARYDAAVRALEVEAALDDPELKAIAAEEAAAARAGLPALEEEIRTALLPRDPDDDKDVIIEVRAGTGGEEAALFASELIRMYLRYAEAQGWKAELADVSPAEAGGVKEATIRIAGDGIYGRLKFESGVHRIQRIPATENKGRIHTSTATVAILPEVEDDVEIIIRPEDLRIDTYRSGGAGGQHVNKTESAVRLTHLPSGVVVACQTERSQLKNREVAMRMLRSRLYVAKKEAEAQKLGQLRSSQIGSGDRSEKIRTYNVPQDRVTDHRLSESFHNLPGLMEGNIGALLESLQKADSERKAAEIA